MRHADHGAFGHAGQVIQHIFNFRRVDIQAAADDQVFAAPNDSHITAVIQRAHVTGDEIAICGEFLRGFLRHAPVPGKHIRTFDLNAAHLTNAQRRAVVANDTQTHPGQRKTHAATHPF